MGNTVLILIGNRKICLHVGMQFLSIACAINSKQILVPCSRSRKPTVYQWQLQSKKCIFMVKNPKHSGVRVIFTSALC